MSERLLELRSNLPPGVEPKMGPISTGLGEIYMWTVGYSQANQDAGVSLTAEGERLESEDFLSSKREYNGLRPCPGTRAMQIARTGILEGLRGHRFFVKKRPLI